MSVNKRRIDVVVRLLVVVALIFGCFDSALLYRNCQKNKSASESEGNDLSAMELIEGAYEDPSQMVTVNEQRYEPVFEDAIGMDYDDSPTDIVPPIIADNDIHISANVNPSVISLSDTLHVSIEIFNNSPEVKRDMVFTDYLNKTLMLTNEINSSVVFDSEENVITYPIDELAVGETLTIEYDLRINAEHVSVPDSPQT
jgi:hypothetical protein